MPGAAALPLSIRPVDAPDAAVETLLRRHQALMQAQSPEESCHVMSAEDLTAAGATVYALRDADGAVLAVGALKPLEAGGVELKSMHTDAARRGEGLGRALLDHLLEAARARGADAAWLETGTAPEFAAARALYLRAGFTECEPFGDYTLDPLSVFMHRTLA